MLRRYILFNFKCTGSSHSHQAYLAKVLPRDSSSPSRLSFQYLPHFPCKQWRVQQYQMFLRVCLYLQQHQKLFWVPLCVQQHQTLSSCFGSVFHQSDYHSRTKNWAQKQWRSNLQGISLCVSGDQGEAVQSPSLTVWMAFQKVVSLPVWNNSILVYKYPIIQSTLINGWINERVQQLLRHLSG